MNDDARSAVQTTATAPARAARWIAQPVTRIGVPRFKVCRVVGDGTYEIAPRAGACGDASRLLTPEAGLQAKRMAKEAVGERFGAQLRPTTDADLDSHAAALDAWRFSLVAWAGEGEPPPRPLIPVTAERITR